MRGISYTMLKEKLEKMIIIINAKRKKKKKRKEIKIDKKKLLKIFNGKKVFFVLFCFVFCFLFFF